MSITQQHTEHPAPLYMVTQKIMHSISLIVQSLILLLTHINLLLWVAMSNSTHPSDHTSQEKSYLHHPHNSSNYSNTMTHPLDSEPFRTILYNSGAMYGNVPIATGCYIAMATWPHRRMCSLVDHFVSPVA